VLAGSATEVTGGDADVFNQECVVDPRILGELSY
jgi:hypothetical protein